MRTFEIELCATRVVGVVVTLFVVGRLLKKETQVYLEFFIFWERENKYLRTWDTKTLEENDFLFVSPLLIGITISCVVVQEDSPLSPPVIPFLLSFDRCLFCLFWNKRKCLWFPTCVGPICFGYRHRHRVAEERTNEMCESRQEMKATTMETERAVRTYQFDIHRPIRCF